MRAPTTRSTRSARTASRPGRGASSIASVSACSGALRRRSSSQVAPSARSAAIASTTLDVRAHVAELQRSDEARLRARIERAVLEGDLPATTDPAALADLVQTLWQGLAARAELGAPREELLGVARLALALLDPAGRAPERAVAAPGPGRLSPGRRG